MNVTEIVIPTVCFVVIGLTHYYEWFKGERSDYTKGFFRRVRKGWIASNFMKGQAAVNTTRDYIRVTVFYAGTAILVATFAVTNSDDKSTLHEIRFGCLAGLMLCIFFCFVQCTRFAIHLSFLINVQYLDGTSIETPSALLEKVFSHAHLFYSLGVRLYFLAIPIISWIISEYVLLGVTLLYCFILRKLDSTNFMSEELADHDKRILEYENENANI
eukprot:421943_1